MCLCPLAPWRPEHPKGIDTQPGFGVHVAPDDVSYYHCFTCKSKGTIGGLAMLLGKLRDEPELIQLGKKIDQDEILGGESEFEWSEAPRTGKDKAKYRVTKFPSEREFEERFPSVIASPRAIAYLRRRRISLDTAFSIGLRYDPAQRRILFPVYDYWTGRYAGCSGRAIGNKEFAKAYEQRTGRDYPKVRDYHGLQKDRVLLFRRGTFRASGNDGRDQHRRTTTPSRPQQVVGVEGLFAFARFVQLGYGNSVVGLLGSELLPAKGSILSDIGLPIFWFTDHDAAGEACLYGRLDVDTGERKPEGGALKAMFHSTAQFVPQWPEFIDDPDDLNREQAEAMIDSAELFTG